MPTVELSLRDLNDLLKDNLSLKQVEDAILFAKGEVEGEEEGKLRIDIKDTNRPDLWSVEGIARELRGHLDKEEGLPEFNIEESGVELIVSKNVAKVRPRIIAAIVKGLVFNDDAIKQMIQLQEKVSESYGRKRKEAAIGIYDFDKIVSPISYKTVSPTGIKFVPLEFNENMTPKEILKKHPKGREYAHLLTGNRYPLLIDSKKNVLSMPPIINSDFTGKVTENTENVFVEVTGYNQRIISTALNVIISALAERNGKIYSVKIRYPDEEVISPDFTPKEFDMDPDYCRRLLGVNVSNEEIMKLLRKARYNVEQRDKIHVWYPAYRDDIMHQNDLIEDVAISMNFNQLEPAPPKLPTIGGLNEKERRSKLLREICIGFGFQEVITFVLSSIENQFDKMNLKKEKLVEIENPVSSNWTCLRKRLLPSLLEFLSYNKHVDFPQRIFEVGDIVEIDEKEPLKTKDIQKVAAVISDNKVGYENISSIIDGFLNVLGVKYSLKRKEHNSFIKGRSAAIVVDGKEIGILGEVNPLVLEKWSLEKPVVAFELNAEALL